MIDIPPSFSLLKKAMMYNEWYYGKKEQDVRIMKNRIHGISKFEEKIPSHHTLSPHS
jgi:hypothetical protein